ncbi:MAG TPA: cyclodeaminase/cyclohydrolase family protein [Actinocatenispora sp.]
MQGVDDWLAELGSAAPTPGGGAAAAMTAAISAGLVQMVANLTTGRARYAEYERDTTRILNRAAELRHDAVALAGEDAEAFAAVMAAYRLPLTDPDRAEHVRAATIVAAEAPLRIAAVAAEVATLAAELPGRSNRNVLSDVAVAASTAAAAIESAAINVEINLSGLPDADREPRARRLAEATAQLGPARELAARLRTEIAG